MRVRSRTQDLSTFLFLLTCAMLFALFDLWLFQFLYRVRLNFFTIFFFNCLFLLRDNGLFITAFFNYTRARTYVIFRLEIRMLLFVVKISLVEFFVYSERDATRWVLQRKSLFFVCTHAQQLWYNNKYLSYQTSVYRKLLYVRWVLFIVYPSNLRGGDLMKHEEIMYILFVIFTLKSRALFSYLICLIFCGFAIIRFM